MVTTSDMRSFLHIVIAGYVLLGPCCASARADGGGLILSERQGDCRVFVFVSPDPLRAGPIDISIMLQDVDSGRPVDDAWVTVSMSPHGHPDLTMSGVATRAAATNKLFYAALMELPDPGRWEVEISYVISHNPAHQVRFSMDAGRPLAPWLAVWPWFGWPFGMVLLFGVHRWLVWKKQTKNL